MRYLRTLILASPLVAVAFTGMAGCVGVQTNQDGDGGSGGSGLCSDAACGQAEDDCCPVACMPADDFDCCEDASCSTVSDTCCPSTCMAAEDSDCCDAASCDQASDGCCPMGCTPADDADCCDSPCSQNADACCPNMCTAANDADCCADATCDQRSDGCCSASCAAADDIDCCNDSSCEDTISDGCCPDSCLPTNDIDCSTPPDSIVVTPTDPSVPLGIPLQFTATAVTDGDPADVTTNVTWASSTEGVATIGNEPGTEGLAMSAGVGTTTISASLPGVLGSPTGSTTLGVTAAELDSIAVTPVDPSVVVGAKQQFTATGRYTDGTEANLSSEVEWSSSTPRVATVSDEPGTDGLATSITAGRTAIRAMDPASGTYGESDLDVTGPTTNRAYVANSGDSSVSVIDIEAGLVVDTISVNDGPFAVATHRAANLAYVTHFSLGIVSVIDTTTNEVLTAVNVGDNPQSVAINEVKNKAYVANPGAWGSGDDTVTIIDTTTHQVIDTVTVGQDPNGIAVADHGNSTGAFVALRGQVKVIDVSTDAVTHTIPIPAGGVSGVACPHGIAYQRATYRMVVLHGTCDVPVSSYYLTNVYSTTKVVDGSAHRVTTAGTATGITVNPAGAGRIYVAHPSTSMLSVIEYVNHTVEVAVPVGEFSTRAAFAGPPHDKVLVANCTGNSVSVVDIGTNTVMKTIDVGSCPRGIGIIP
jgi:YVTN family beta-propeller protein